MGHQRTRLLERSLLRRTRAFWSRAARAAESSDLSVLRKRRDEAQFLRQKLDDLMYHAENRLSLPHIGPASVPQLPGTDWAWRPQLWCNARAVKGLSAVESKTKVGHEVTVFHDGQTSELTLRQMRNTRQADVAPFGVCLDVFHFDGSFLSLVLDLPEQACTGLLRRHLVRLEAAIEVERPIEIFARLNVRHGPNTEQIVRKLPLEEGRIVAEFDLTYTKLNEKRIEAMWVDLIFEDPQMNRITLRDVTFSRNPRAEL